MLRYCWIGLLGVCCSLWSCTVGGRRPLTVGVAASVYPAMQALQKIYTEQYGHSFDLKVHASGKLSAQIEQGLVLDLFLSADTTYPAYLYENGYGAAAPVVYAEGQLVLWVAKNGAAQQGWGALRSPSIRRLALARPEVAPYGVLALQALQANDQYKSLAPRLVYGSSIAQVNQYIRTQSIDAALTARSSLYHAGIDSTYLWVVPNHRLAQSMLLLQSDQRPPTTAARQLYTFLQSKEAQRIFQAYGYAIP